MQINPEVCFQPRQQLTAPERQKPLFSSLIDGHIWRRMGCTSQDYDGDIISILRANQEHKGPIIDSLCELAKTKPGKFADQILNPKSPIGRGLIYSRKQGAVSLRVALECARQFIHPRQSIADFLFIMRLEIIGAVTNDLNRATYDAMLFNRLCSFAQKNYGVIAFMPEAHQPDENQQECLNRAFKEKYQPLQIITWLVVALRSYTQEMGREELKTFFATLLGCDIDEEQLFNHDVQRKELYLIQILFREMQKEKMRYLEFSTKENAFIEALFNTAHDESPLVDANEEISPEVISLALDLLSQPHLLNCIPLPRKNALIGLVFGHINIALNDDLLLQRPVEYLNNFFKIAAEAKHQLPPEFYKKWVEANVEASLEGTNISVNLEDLSALPFDSLQDFVNGIKSHQYRRYDLRRYIQNSADQGLPLLLSFLQISDSSLIVTDLLELVSKCTEEKRQFILDGCKKLTTEVKSLLWNKDFVSKIMEGKFKAFLPYLLEEVSSNPDLLPDTALMNILLHYPEQLSAFLKRISTLSMEQQSKLWGASIASRTLVISRLSPYVGIQEFVHYPENALAWAARAENKELLDALLLVSYDLDTKAQSRVFFLRNNNQEKVNLLTIGIDLLLNDGDNRLFKRVHELDPEIIAALWIQLSESKYWTYLFYRNFNEGFGLLIPTLDLSPEAQESIWSKREFPYTSHQANAQHFFLTRVCPLVQIAALTNSPYHESNFSLIHQWVLKHTNSVSTRSQKEPLAAGLRHCLENVISTVGKKINVLCKFLELMSQNVSADRELVIEKALQNPQSDLYRALNRSETKFVTYGGIFSNQTSSLEYMLAIINRVVAARKLESSDEQHSDSVKSP